MCHWPNDFWEQFDITSSRQVDVRRFVVLFLVTLVFLLFFRRGMLAGLLVVDRVQGVGVFNRGVVTVFIARELLGRLLGLANLTLFAGGDLALRLAAGERRAGPWVNRVHEGSSGAVTRR